jgi:hypothetical protein
MPDNSGTLSALYDQRSRTLPACGGHLSSGSDWKMRDLENLVPFWSVHVLVFSAIREQLAREGTRVPHYIVGFIPSLVARRVVDGLLADWGLSSNNSTMSQQHVFEVASLTLRLRVWTLMRLIRQRPHPYAVVLVWV